MAVQKIGRYEVLNELGQGGMAVVYLARDPFMNRQVAIKVLPRQFTFDPQFRARFKREAEAVASLEHPAIVPVYDYGEHDEQPFIVMRYMPGATLADKIGKPEARTGLVRILARVAQALDEAHTRGIVHRDLKPSNVLFDAWGEAYLSDFGIAKLAESSGTYSGSMMLGTPAYMSPEQARGERDIDGRSDIYALGVMLFEMLTGRKPYEADTPMGIAVKHVTEPVPSILAAKPDLPVEYERIINKALAKDKEVRYQTAAELARAVNDVMGGAPTVLPPSPAVQPDVTRVADSVPAPRSAPATQALPADMEAEIKAASEAEVASATVAGALAGAAASPPTKLGAASEEAAGALAGAAASPPTKLGGTGGGAGVPPAGALAGAAAEPPTMASSVSVTPAPAVRRAPSRGLAMGMVIGIGLLAILAIGGGALLVSMNNNRATPTPTVTQTIAPTQAPPTEAPPSVTAAVVLPSATASSTPEPSDTVPAAASATQTTAASATPTATNTVVFTPAVTFAPPTVTQQLSGCAALPADQQADCFIQATAVEAARRTQAAQDATAGVPTEAP